MSSTLHHVTFHLWKCAVLLSVPERTTLEQLKTQLIPALQPLADSLPVPPPKSEEDIELWEETPDGPSDIDKLETDLSIAAMGWPRYKTIFVSIRNESGTFDKPVYTVPHPEDGDAEE